VTDDRGPRRVQDLGHGVTARLITGPAVGPYRDEYVGAIITRPNQHADGSRCEGVIYWLSEERDLWNVNRLDPLDVSPSISCPHRDCTFHGHIREGRWEPV
jgi:hypothetical protein